MADELERIPERWRERFEFYSRETQPFAIQMVQLIRELGQAENRHVQFMVEGGPVVMAADYADLQAKLEALQAELQQEREDARRIIGLRQDRIDALTAELGNVRTQWNRMRIAKERAEAKNAALEARLETLTTENAYRGALLEEALIYLEECDAWQLRGSIKKELARTGLASRSQQAPASEEKP